MTKLTTIKNRLFTYLAVLLLIGSGCTERFDEFNRDKDEISELNSTLYAGAFNKAVRRSMYWYDNDIHPICNAVTLHCCGYSTTGFIAQDRNAISDVWNSIAFDGQIFAITWLKALMEIAEDDDQVTYNVAKIYRSYCFLLATDVWGPLPYKDMGSGKEKVIYESQKDIYYQLFEDLTAATTFLTVEVNKNPNLNVFGEGDLFFFGNVKQWIKFANVIRLRMALRISNIDPAKAKNEGEAAIKTNMLLKHAIVDDITYPVDPMYKLGRWGNENGYCKLNGWGTVIMSNSMESFMVGWDDPRVSEYWSPADTRGWNPEELPELAHHLGKYCGLASGALSTIGPVFAAHSRMGARFHPDLASTTPIHVFNAAETWFLLAEAGWKGWDGAGNIKDNYETGIRESMKQWGITDNSRIEAYISNTASPKSVEFIHEKITGGKLEYEFTIDNPMTSIGVKFSTNREEQYEQILTQKWLALFPNSIEAWAEFRRTRLPKIFPKKASENPNVDLSKGQILTRLPYCDDEVAANPEAITQAIGFLGGPNLETTPLWWDVNPNGR